MIIASIDIGTNTVLLLIAEIEKSSRSFKVLENMYRIPRLGRNLTPGGSIPDLNLGEFYKVLEEYSKVIKDYNCDHILTGATSAFRQASNSGQIIADVKAKYNLDINIITGEEEAVLSYTGAVHSYDSGGVNMVIDIGGGSTEIITGEGEYIKFSRSFPVGVVNSSEKYYRGNVFDVGNFSSELSDIFQSVKMVERAPDKVIAVAGTPTTLACIKKNLPVFNEELVEGTILTVKDLEDLVELLNGLSPQQIAERYKPVVIGREDLILSGSIILLYLLNLINIPEVIVSTKGIRYGLIYKFLKGQ